MIIREEGRRKSLNAGTRTIWRSLSVYIMLYYVILYCIILHGRVRVRVRLTYLVSPEEFDFPGGRSFGQPAMMGEAGGGFIFTVVVQGRSMWGNAYFKTSTFFLGVLMIYIGR